MAAPQTPLTVALIGNPNTGKSTLFSALVGIHQHVGNYPGVTVEKKLGRMEHCGCRFEVIDLPGLYSLAPRSRDEMVAVDVLLGRREELAAVDAVVCLVDAANLQRNFYLLSQVLELGLPTVVAVNMVDVAARRGISIDFPGLQERLAVAVVPTEANHGVGLDELKAALVEATHGSPHTGGLSASSSLSRSLFPEVFEHEVTRLEAESLDAGSDGPLPRSLVRRLLLDANGYLQHALLGDDGEAQRRLTEARRRLAGAGCCVPAVETEVRYGWARAMLDGLVTQPGRFQVTASDRADRVLTHRVWGLVVFVGLMLLVFQAMFVWAQPASDAINSAAARVGGWISAAMVEGPLQSLLVDGILRGVGSVLAFLPQILLLFFFIAVLEDCGYMARAACLMDRLMARVGLSGRSFIPMLSSCACAVPGIMATRVIENERDRLTTILVAPLMTCSARLQVYILLIAAFIPAADVPGWLARSARAHVGGVLCPGHHGRGRRGHGAEANALARAVAAAADGIARLPVALAADRTGADARPRLGLRPFGRHADPGHFDRRLGSPLLSARSARRPASQPVGPPGPGDRAGRPPAGLGLADRLRGAGLLSTAGGGDRHAGRDVQRRREARRRVGRRAKPVSAAIAACPLGGQHAAGLHGSRGLVDHGLLRVMCPMCGHVGGDSPRDEQLALAGVHVCLHDGAGVCRRLFDVSNRDLVGRIADLPSTSGRGAGGEGGLEKANTMVLDWQNVCSLALVLLSAIYVAWRLLRALRRRGASVCGCCRNCPSTPKPVLPRLTTISDQGHGGDEGRGRLFRLRPSAFHVSMGFVEHFSLAFDYLRRLTAA